MQSMSDIRHRIEACRQTRQITRAMNLISAAKMHKSSEMAKRNAVYVARVRSAMKDILLHTGRIEHPFIKKEEGFKLAPYDAYIVISGDKGLAGGYNSNVHELALAHMQDNPQEKYIVAVGQMSRAFFQHRGLEVDDHFQHIAQNPTLHNARLVAHILIDLYQRDEIDEVLVAHTRMDSPLVQTPCLTRLLPIFYSDFEDADSTWFDPNRFEREIAYEPSAKQVLDVLVTQYVVGRVYGALVQSFASEQVARMRAMSTATENADDMIRKLQLSYNRARQAAITNEIAEIIGGAAALSQQ